MYNLWERYMHGFQFVKQLLMAYSIVELSQELFNEYVWAYILCIKCDTILYLNFSSHTKIINNKKGYWVCIWYTIIYEYNPLASVLRCHINIPCLIPPCYVLNDNLLAFHTSNNNMIGKYLPHSPGVVFIKKNTHRKEIMLSRYSNFIPRI